MSNSKLQSEVSNMISTVHRDNYWIIATKALSNPRTSATDDCLWQHKERSTVLLVVRHEPVQEEWIKGQDTNNLIKYFVFHTMTSRKGYNIKE
jgi:hypothetical protein